MTDIIITQLVVDASGAKEGVDAFKATLASLKQAQADGGVGATAFDAAMRRWVNSLAAADPVIRASINMQKALQQQTEINATAVKLGITTQDAAVQQLERVRAKQQSYVDAAKESTSATSQFKEGISEATEFFAKFGIALGVGEVISFAKELFNAAAQLDNQARAAGVSVEALQAYRLEMRQGGVDQDSADAAVRRFTRSLGDAVDAAGPARQAIFDLSTTGKVAFSDLNLGAESVLPKVAGALLAIQDPARRAHDEIALFGRAGQEIEGALKALATDTATAEERARALGLLLGGDVARQAHDADTAFGEAAERLKNSLTPSVVGAANAGVGLLDAFTRLADADSMWDKLLGRLAQVGGPLGTAYALAISGVENAINGRPTAPTTPTAAALAGFERSQFVDPEGHVNLPTGSYGSINGVGVSTKELDDLNAKALQQKALVGETASVRAQDVALMNAGEVALKQMGDTTSHILNTQDAIRAIEEVKGKLVGDQYIANIRAGAELKQQATVHDHIRETLGEYVSKLSEGARLAGLTTTEKEDELSIIKAAQIAETERGVKAKDLTQTYQGALDALHRYGQDQAATDIRAADATGHVNTLLRQQGEQIEQLNAGLGMTADQRALIAKDMQDELTAGAGITEEQRAQIENNNMIIQQKQRINAVADAVNSPHDQNVRNIGDIRAGVAGGQIAPGRGAEAIGENPLSRGLSDMDQSIGNQMAISPDAKFNDDIKQAKLLETTRTNILDDALKARLVTEEQYNVRRKDIAAAAADDLAKIDQAQQDQRLQAASDFFGSLAYLSQSSNATLAAIGKAAAISQATIDGILAVQKALAHYPPPLSYIMAAGAGVAAAANVAKIVGLADGVVSIQRQGGGPSDIIPTMLTPGESVVNVVGTNRNFNALAAMNAGASFDASRNWSPSAPAPANSNTKPFNVIVNAPPGSQVSRRQSGDDEIIDIVDARVEAGVFKHGPKMLQAELSNSNNKGAQAVKRLVGPKS